MITFTVEDRNGERRAIEVPEGISMSLMEVLKASEYQVLATCGGMALCATCLVQVLQGQDNLGDPTDAELDMLDTLPDTDDRNRLSCQIRIDGRLKGCVFKIGSPT